MTSRKPCALVKEVTETNKKEKMDILDVLAKRRLGSLHTDKESIDELASMGVAWNPYYESKIMSGSLSVRYAN
jgi:hypothetical protein